MYFAVKSLYLSTEACVKVNNLYTPWFDYTYGVKQGDSLSPTLFNIFIDDLAKKIKDLQLGVDIDGTKYCILMYADDVVLMAESENDLQKMLDTVYTWMTKWRITLNLKKSKCIHSDQKHWKKRTTNFILIMFDLNFLNLINILVCTLTNS